MGHHQHASARQHLQFEEVGDRKRTQLLGLLETSSGLHAYLRHTRWTNRLPLNTEALNATQAKVQLDDIAQLADKSAEGTPLACFANVS